VTTRRWSLAAIAIVALLLVVGHLLADVYTDFRWYQAMGAIGVWRERLIIVTLVRLTSGAVAALFVFANLYAVRQSVVSIVLPRQVANLEIGEEVPGRYLMGAVIVMAVILGALLTLPASTWTSLSLLHGGRPFGESDPYFEADLSFFVYWLPFESALYLWALIAVLVVSALVIFLYALTPSLRWERGSLYVSNYVRRHVVVLGTLMLLLLAWNYRLDAFRVLVNGSGPAGMFTFSDHHAAIPVSLWLAILTVAAAFIVLFFGWTGQFRVAFIAVTTVIILSLAMRALGPPLVRHLARVQDATARGAPYRQVRLEYTRRAYALDRITVGDSLGFRSLPDAASSVSLWDAAALLRASATLEGHGESPRGIAWMPAPSGLEAVVIRGGPTDDISDGAPTGPWTITRIGAALTNAAGDPELLPATSMVASDTLPPVLVNDSAIGYRVITDRAGRIAAPELSSMLSRLAFAWSLRDIHLLSKPSPEEVYRVEMRRDVRERVHAIAPFFHQGTHVRPLVVDDSLSWVLDLYVGSAWYPLSEHVAFGGAEVSYLRHAAVAIVNAHTGRVELLPDATPDPVAESWRERFPTLFAEPADVPAALRRALPPMVDLTRIQASVLARTGWSSPKQPLGHLPWNEGADSLLRDEDVPPLMLPDGRLAWLQPMLDSSEYFRAALLGTGGARRASYLVLATDSTQRWNAILDRLRRGMDSTADLPRDAHLVHGPVRVLPLARGAAIVQTAYAWRPNDVTSIARVATTTDTTLRAGATFAEAFGAAGSVHADSASVHPRNFRADVAALYERMGRALQHGDWVSFGRAYDALGALIQKSKP
jgi:hypothetical protein